MAGCAGVVVWGVYGTESAAAYTNLTVWLSTTADFRLNGIQCSEVFTPSTALKPFTLLCNRTLPGTRCVRACICTHACEACACACAHSAHIHPMYPEGYTRLRMGSIAYEDTNK